MNQNRFPPPTSPQNPNGQHETTAPPTNPVYPDLNTKARITGIYYCPFPRALAKPDHPPWFRGTYMALFFMAMVIVMQLIDAGTIFTPGTMIGLAFLLFVSITLATIGFFILNSNQRTLANWTPLAERNTPANTRCYQVCRSVFQEKIPGGSFKKLDPRATPLLRRVTSNQIQTMADDQYQ